MPHINVKMFKGRSEEQKKALTEALAIVFRETLGSKDESISIVIEDFNKEDWGEKVYHPEIMTAPAETLFKKPGYTIP